MARWTACGFRKSSVWIFYIPSWAIPPSGFPRLLPPPLNLLAGFMRYRPVDLGDVVGLRRVRTALAAPLQCGITVNEWLEECRQSPAIRQAFWDPLCISALNQHPDSAPARHLASVLKLAFFGYSDSTLMGYPGVGLSAMYTDAARNFIHRHGGTCHIGEAATELRVAETGKIRIRLKSGAAVTADAAICAITPPALFRLLPEGLDDLKIRLKSFYPSPILSVNLWFRAPVLNRPFVGLLSGRMDWIFNKPMLYNGRDKASPGHVTMVASAADRLVDQPDERLVAIAMGDLHKFLPETRNIPLERHLVVRERHATFALPKGHSPPPNRTAAPGLYIAGDWTDTGLPATVEKGGRRGKRIPGGGAHSGIPESKKRSCLTYPEVCYPLFDVDPGLDVYGGDSFDERIAFGIHRGQRQSVDLVEILPVVSLRGQFRIRAGTRAEAVVEITGSHCVKIGACADVFARIGVTSEPAPRKEVRMGVQVTHHHNRIFFLKYETLESPDFSPLHRPGTSFRAPVTTIRRAGGPFRLPTAIPGVRPRENIARNACPQVKRIIGRQCGPPRPFPRCISTLSRY